MKYKKLSKRMNPPYSIILADDHLPFRREMKKIIEEIPGVKIVGEAANGPELFAFLERSQPDMVILDIAMPGLRAMWATRQIKEKYPGIHIVIMVLDEEIEYRIEGHAAGAEAVLLKQNAAADIGRAIEQIRRGKLSPHGLGRGAPGSGEGLQVLWDEVSRV